MRKTRDGCISYAHHDQDGGGARLRGVGRIVADEDDDERTQLHWPTLRRLRARTRRHRRAKRSRLSEGAMGAFARRKNPYFRRRYFLL